MYSSGSDVPRESSFRSRNQRRSIARTFNEELMIQVTDMRSRLSQVDSISSDVSMIKVQCSNLIACIEFIKLQQSSMMQLVSGLHWNYSSTMPMFTVNPLCPPLDARQESKGADDILSRSELKRTCETGVQCAVYQEHKICQTEDIFANVAATPSGACAIDVGSLWDILENLSEEAPPTLEEAIMNTHGDWQRLPDSSLLEVGDVVQLGSATTSLNTLSNGLQGLVEKIDDDGDLYVYFPSLQKHHGKHWVDVGPNTNIMHRRSLCHSLGGTWQSDSHTCITVANGTCYFSPQDEGLPVLQVGENLYFNGWCGSLHTPAMILWEKADHENIIWRRSTTKVSCNDDLDVYDGLAVAHEECLPPPPPPPMPSQSQPKPKTQSRKSKQHARRTTRIMM